MERVEFMSYTADSHQGAMKCVSFTFMHDMNLDRTKILKPEPAKNCLASLISV